MSARRRRDLAERRRVREAVIARDGGCVLRPGTALAERADIGACGWYRDGIEVHEIIGRGQWAAGWLVAGNCVALCPCHHDWVETHPTAAAELGLSKSRGIDDGVSR